MLRRAPRLRRGALLIRGPPMHDGSVGPGSAVQREGALHRVRDTESYFAKNRPEAIRGKWANGQL
jgi:hypothetical protein